MIHSGAGSDTIFDFVGDNRIRAGDGDDLVSVGPGNDRIWTDGGNDTVVAGEGDNQVHAGGGGEIAGWTLYDSDLAALDAIMLEWASVASYSTRVGHLRGTMTGGVNATSGVYLRGSDAAAGIGNQTVFDDGAVDRLTGNQGTDWFLANTVTDNSAAKDIITELAANEQTGDTDLDLH